MPPSGNTSFSELGWITSKDVERAKIGDYREKILVLDMYATWCAPCRDSIPQLIELQRRYGSKGLQIVGLNVGGPDDRVKVRQFAQELGINYPLGFPDRQLTDLLMADDSSIPQTFVFSRDGALVQRFIGYRDIAAGQLENLIQTQTAANAP
jgi:thiol-disulfide isomerase/thioredoxin